MHTPFSRKLLGSAFSCYCFQYTIYLQKIVTIQIKTTPVWATLLYKPICNAVNNSSTKVSFLVSFSILYQEKFSTLRGH